MAGAGAPERRPVHGRPGHRDRERRAAVDPGRSRVLAGEPAVGDQRVRARLRRLPAPRRAGGRPARAQAHLPRRRGRVHGRLAARRPGLVGGVVDRARAPSRGSARRSSPRPRSRSSRPRSPKGASATSRSASGAPSAASGPRPASCSGGILTDALSWEWIFFVNVPVGVAAFALAPLLLAESRDARVKRFDVPGAVLVTGGLSLLVYAITQAGQDGWLAGQTLALLRGRAGSACRLRRAGSSGTPSR